jgi:hypothetical protein
MQENSLSFPIAGFEVEIGGIDYGFPIHGILGMDFLCATDAKIDLGQFEIDFPSLEQ